jgi:GT2 family glycosyltransferase
LAAIAACDFTDIEVIVVDNASRDGTTEYLRAEHPTVKLLCNDRNLGHSRGVNQGIQSAIGDYVLVLDADAELSPGALGTMVDFLSDHEAVAIVSPQLLNTDGSPQHTSRSFPTGINGLFGRHSFLTRVFPNNPWSRRYLMTDAPPRDGPYPVEQVSAACMLFPRALVAEVGPWDERYFAYWVDTAWCWRVRSQGWPIYCIPAARVTHHESNRPDRPKSLLRIWLFHSGALRFYRTSRRFGWLDPRVWVALLGLTLRGLFQLVQSTWMRWRIAWSRRATTTPGPVPK